MRLIEFTDVRGNTLYINPDNVVSVYAETDHGIIIATIEGEWELDEKVITIEEVAHALQHHPGVRHVPDNPLFEEDDDDDDGVEVEVDSDIGNIADKIRAASKQ